YLALEAGRRPRTVMTIHNMTYQGLFPRALLAELGLPATCFTIDGVEFYGKISFLKAGIAYADRITTVSPTYALEIQLVAAGGGLDGLLSRRAQALTGILNGVDYRVWNPASTPYLDYHYDARQRSAGRSPSTASSARWAWMRRLEPPCSPWSAGWRNRRGSTWCWRMSPTSSSWAPSSWC